MKHLYIDTNPDGVTGEVHSPDYEMCILYDVLWDIPENSIELFKQKITNGFKNGQKNIEWNFEYFQITIPNHEDFLIYDSLDEGNTKKKYLYIKQETLWQAIREYNNIDTSKKYKRITISYDGKKVYFDLEPFETSKENE